MGDYLTRLGDKMRTITQNGANDLVDAWSKPWASATDAPEKLASALESIPARIVSAYNAAGEKIKAIRAELAKPVVANVATPSPDELAKDKKAHKVFAEASLFGSKEAASAVLRSKFGVGAKDGTAENTKRSADSLARLEAVQRETNKLLRDRALGISLEF